MATTKTRRESADHASNGKTVKAGGSIPARNGTVTGEDPEVQHFGEVVDRPIKLEESERAKSCEQMNGVLADTQILYALYKKHHWLMRGPTFYRRAPRRDADRSGPLNKDEIVTIEIAR